MASDKPREVWQPVDYTVDEHRAIQALAVYAMGADQPLPPGQEAPVPSPRDVKLALDWIIHKAARTYDNGFVPNDPNGRVAAFVDGSQSVGQQIVKLMKVRVSIHER